VTSGITYTAAGNAGPPLVLLHGIGGQAIAFGPLLRHLSREFRCVAWNMPGYGGSLPLEPMTFPGLVDRLVAFLDELGLTSAHLLGHSLGGMIALEFAARLPHRVRSLVLVATTAAFGQRDGEFQRRFIAERTAPLDAGLGMEGLARALVPQLLGADFDPEAETLAQSSLASIPEAAYRAALECVVSFDRRDALTQLPMPVLVLAGGRDRQAPAAVMERMAARIPHARFMLIPDAGHLLPLERPRELAAAVSDFLRRIEPEGDAP
jgi:pimeloyl-ACP methyl ester carboxylesterase